MKRTLGTCYYPEHWPREIWDIDAAKMKDVGLTFVRIGEFAWSRLEPREGQYEFDWLDEAINVLGQVGLKIVLGTPTATPPRWIVSKHPDMLAIDEQGNPRGFGSRRHYCFSHAGYRQECERIVTKLAERYAGNPHIVAWQTDNEYGCHDTTLSYSQSALIAFRNWLRERYQSNGYVPGIEVLNLAWGNVFWSMEYSDFDEIGLPSQTVTEANPSHVLAFRRFSSDQVASFNALQTKIIRQHSTADITHNFMGRITDFDHFQVGQDLDFASWDSYPLGFLEDRISESPQNKKRFARQGNCDFQAFHHDLYRAVGRNRFWVMEQQPGPVNWAPFNPDPAPGMVRLWSWEAFAHGAEVVSYFRWRQLPSAQEQLHAGLLRPDSEPAPGLTETARVAEELKVAENVEPWQAPVALIFDYDADFCWKTQPHGLGQDYFQQVFDLYCALRSLGMSVDILSPQTREFKGYHVVFAPGLMHLPDGLKATLIDSEAVVVFGPRSGSRTLEMHIPVPLPPDIPQLKLLISRVESLRPDMPIQIENGGSVIGFREFVETDAQVVERTVDGEPLVIKSSASYYVVGSLDLTAMRRIFGNILRDADLQPLELPDGVRVRETGTEIFWFNYDQTAHSVADMNLEALSVWRELK